MKAIVAVFADGARHMLFVQGDDFDTQAWANSRQRSFSLLGIVRVEERYAEAAAS